MPDSQQAKTVNERWKLLLWLGPLLLIGFWFRLTFLTGNIYYGDEFISMLAAKMVAEQGLPIFPSGMFYDHGLLYSMLAGAFIAALGFSEQIARWPVLLVGVLTIAVYARVSKLLFGSYLTGIIAAILVALDTTLIKWGVWARMYALAHMFVLLSLAWLLVIAFKDPSRRNRYLFLAFLAGALFSHSLTFLTLPPLALFLGLGLIRRREWLGGRNLWLQGVIAGVIIVSALLVAARGHVGSTASLQEQPEAAVEMPAGLEFLQGFFRPDLDEDHYMDLFQFFQTPAYSWLVYVIGAGLLISLYRFGRRTATFGDTAFLLTALFLGLIIWEIGSLLTEEWRQSRYMIFLTLPAFLLLSAESLSRLVQGILRFNSNLNRPFLAKRWLEPVLLLLVMGVIASVWGLPSWHIVHARATGDYDTAYEYVRGQWQPGDRIMTEHPAAAYLYMEQMDYYANQVSAKILSEEENEFAPIDRYTGSPLVDTVAAFNAALAEGQRVWLVVSDKHLSRYDPFLRQQIFAQMDFVYQAGSKYVFMSRPHPVPLLAEPDQALDGNFIDSILLAGYTLDPAAPVSQEAISLGLYWRLIGDPPARPFKLFVQLRNGQGEMIAQADHFIFEGLLHASEWNMLRQNDEWLRDMAYLPLAGPLPPEAGPYHIYVGFYDPTTLERVPLRNDTTGENAVVIDLPPALRPG